MAIFDKQVNSYLSYSFQLITLLSLSMYVGNWLDKQFWNGKNILIVVLPSLSILVSLISIVYKTFSDTNKKHLK